MIEKSSNISVSDMSDNEESIESLADSPVKFKNSNENDSSNVKLIKESINGKVYYDLLFYDQFRKPIPEKFSGQTVDYPEFKFNFQYKVWTQDIDEDIKFKILKYCIEDVVSLDFIRKWRNRSTNIEEAFEYMDNKYRVRVDDVIDEYLRQHKVLRGYNLKDLKSLYANLMTTINFCKGFNLLESYKFQIFNAVYLKIPHCIKKEFVNDTFGFTLGDLQTLLLKVIIKIKEFSNKKKRYKKRKHDEAFGETFDESTGESSSKFVDEKYWKSKLSYTARMEILLQRGLCKNCLIKGHTAKECKHPSMCHRCNKKHHHSLCLKKIPFF